jgi:hypothetical protein
VSFQTSAGPIVLRRATRLLLLGAFWTLLGLFFVSEVYLASAVMGRPLSWSQAMWYQLPGWYIWALLAPVIVALGRRVRIERETWVFGVLFHASASALFSLVHLVTAVALGGLVSTVCTAVLRVRIAWPESFHG